MRWNVALHIALIVLCLLCSSLAAQTTNCAAIDEGTSSEGIVSLWTGEGTPLDSYRRNNGILIAGLSFTNGKVGQCFNFTAPDQEVLVPIVNVDIGSRPGMTVEAWINPADVNTQSPIVEWNSGSALGAHLWIGVSYAGFGGPGSIYAVAENGNEGTIIATPPNVLTSGVWQHIAWTYDHRLARLYLNGIQVASRDIGTPNAQTFYPLHIGHRPGGDTYRGLLDEVTLYSRALSSNEIRAIYLAGSNGKCQPPPPRPPTPLASVEFRWRNPLPMGNLLHRAAYGSNLFVAVGGPGQIFTSPDGAVWSQQSGGTSNGLSTIAFGRGLFVAAGEHGTILASTNGTNWAASSSGTVQALRGATHDGNRFVLVGDAGTILTSSNGLTWTPASNSVSRPLTSVTFGQNQFVAVGEGGTILTSPDGSTWTQRNSGTARWLSDVAFGNGTFVAVGFDGTILTSADVVTWTGRNSGGTERLLGVTFGNGQFVTVGTPGKIVTSPDGQIWTPQNSGTGEPLYSVAFGNGTFVVLGGDLVPVVLTSSDARIWTSRHSGDTRTLYDVAFGNGTFVAVGARGAILSSVSNGVWQARHSGVVTTLRNVAFGNGLFVAVGQRETILTSPDGIVWTQRSMFRTKPDPGFSVYTAPIELTAVCYGAGQFVVMSPGEIVVSSTNGETFVPFASPVLGQDLEARPRSVAFGNGSYMAVGFKIALGVRIGWSWTSNDGKNWLRGGGGGEDVIFADSQFVTLNSASVAYGNGIYMAVQSFQGALRPILFSGATPQSLSPQSSLRHNPNTTRKLYAITFGNGTFVTVGENGTVLQSPSIAAP